jgi:tetratricopeptide (TPR) repeat protein
MKQHRSILTITLLVTVLSLLLTSATKAREPKLPKPNDRWIQVETANFTLFSNAPEKMTKKAGANLEQLRAVLATLFGGMRFSSPVPTYIFVFDDSKSFAPYGPFYQGKVKEVGGYFGAGRLANHVAIVGHQYSTDVSSIIYHEYLHYVLNANQAELPLWMNEGLAELYSSFYIEDGVASIGYPIGNHLVWLRNNSLIPLSELITIDKDSPEYNEGHRRGVFYAQSWALTHMLVMGKSEGQSRATVYADLLQQGVDPDKAFQEALGGTTKEIEKELNRYVRGKKFSYSKLPVNSAFVDALKVTEMTYPEVLYRLGSLLTDLGPERHDFAARHFRESLAYDEGFGPSIAGLGRIDELAGRNEAALARYERAAELAPDDYLVNFLLGSILFQKYGDAKTTDEKSDLANRTRSALRRAAVFRPSFAEAWSMLGTTYTWDSEPDDMGIKAMEHAHRLLPKRGDVGYNLTLLYYRRDRLEDALEVVSRMRAAGVDENMVRAAEDLTDSLETRRADTFLRIHQAGAGGAAAENAAELEAQQVQDSAERRDFTDRYNEVVSLINAGKIAEGITILETLVNDAPSEGHSATARALLVQTRAFDSFRDRAEKAQTLANSGEIEAAIEILEPLVERAPDEIQADQIRQFLAKLHAYRDFQKHYNEAVDLVNRGDFEDAIAILEPLVTSSPTPQLTAMAERLLNDLKKKP